MTRRIALAILATVWMTLIIVGVGAYWTTRAVLVADLDAAMIARAVARPEIVDAAGKRYEPVSQMLKDDRFIILSELNRTIGGARPTTNSTLMSRDKPEVIRAVFVKLPGGGRDRSVTLRAHAYPADGGDDAPLESVTVVYTGSADEVDRLLNQLAASLVFTGALGGLLAAVIARSAARRALRPLRATADLVGSIDDSNLHRRLDATSMPEELTPIAIKLNEMLARLEDSSRQRQQFLADASHELRTPVAAMLTAIEVALRRERDANGYRDTLEMCLHDARLLQRLVEALLSQVRSGSLQPAQAVEQVNLGQLIEACAKTLSPLAEERNVAISLPRNPPVISLNTQVDRLRSIFLNLMSNGVQYNSIGGSLTVDFGPERGGVGIRVADTGPGISPEHLPHLFDAFYRADSSRSVGHLGLGLYLVQSHAQALGGTCDVSSVVGQGTVFRVWIPILDENSMNQNHRTEPAAAEHR